VDIDYEHIPDFCQNCKVIGHHIENCKRWNKEEEEKTNQDNITKKKPSSDPKPSFVQARDGRTQQGKSKEVINVDTEVINVEENSDKDQQPPLLVNEIGGSGKVSITPPDKEPPQLKEKELVVAGVVDPKALLLAQDIPLENELNKNLEPILTPIPSASSQGSMVNATQVQSGSKGNSSNSASLLGTPERVIKDMNFLKNSWAVMVEEEEEEDDQIEDTAINEVLQDSGFQVVLSKAQKINQKKKKQTSGNSYGTRSRVNQKPFK
jgi:hypothetical protein